MVPVVTRSLGAWHNNKFSELDGAGSSLEQVDSKIASS